MVAHTPILNPDNAIVLNKFFVEELYSDGRFGMDITMTQMVLKKYTSLGVKKIIFVLPSFSDEQDIIWRDLVWEWEDICPSE